MSVRTPGNFGANDVAKALVGRGALNAGKDGKHTAAMYISALKKTERVYVLTPVRSRSQPEA